MLALLRRQWFIVGVVLSIVLAAAYPPLGIKGGPLRPEYTVKYFVVSLIFFNSGLSLRLADLVSAMRDARLYLVVQTFSMALVPIFMSAILALVGPLLFSEELMEGLPVLSCMPPPVSSAVILTKSVGGNEAGAILNSTLGSFLGIVVTPMLLLWTVGASAAAPVGNIAFNLTATVLLPLIAGQLVRARAADWIRDSGIPFGTISSVALLSIIYTTFCQTFVADVSVTPHELVTTIIFLVTFHLGCIALSYVYADAISEFSKADMISIMFCSSHKSLTLGIPMINILFQGHPHMSIIAIPLLIFHPMQIVVGSLLVEPMKRWLVAATHLQ